VLTLPLTTRIFVATARVDGRKGMDGLAAIVRAHFGREPLDGHLYVFFSRRADRMRVLYFAGDGYVLVTKRREKGTFHTPTAQSTGTHIAIDAAELTLLLEGIDLRETKRRPRWQVLVATA
jgi:transposase